MVLMSRAKKPSSILSRCFYYVVFYDFSFVFLHFREPRRFKRSEKLRVYLYSLQHALKLNPDQRQILEGRHNAAGVDLNRNFPDQFKNPSDRVQPIQPETQAIMDWIKR